MTPARGNQLKPGARCAWKANGRNYEMFFVRRITPATHQVKSAKNVFRVPKFEGLDGPADKGIAEFSDRQVAREVFLYPLSTAARRPLPKGPPLAQAGMNEPKPQKAKTGARS